MKWHHLFFAFQTLGATALAAWLLYRWEELFPRLRPVHRDIRRIEVLTIVFYSAFMPANLGWDGALRFYSRPLFALGAYFYVSLIAVLTYLLHRWVSRRTAHRHRPTVISFLTIALCPFLLDCIGQYAIGLRGQAYVTNISYALFVGCCAGLLHLFLRFYRLKKDLHLSELNNLRIQAELDALQARINPHFLYNALSGLAGLSLEDGRRASRMATELSHLFRYNLNKEQQPLATVQEELEMTRTYLAIEQIRFEDRLQVELNVDEQARLRTMPRFLLQPLVENCIQHGFRHMREPGRIELLICAGERLRLEIRDNGQPFPPHVKQGYGLQGIRQKLELLYPGRHHLQLENQPRKAVIIELEDEKK